ncbi:DUF2330 domain-containing protein, partial [Candidatus Poribacteria bacterium]|nr:DUF2330 domain-containing protein [Candidatus Poribacteria bacterium]
MTSIWAARSYSWLSAVCCNSLSRPWRVVVVALALFALTCKAWGPCVVFGPPGGGFGSVGQQAIYVVQPGSAAKYRVVLVPRVQVRGNPTDVGILVPTPSPPEFQTVGASVFDEGGWLTAPLWRSRSNGGGCGFVGGDDEVAVDSPTADDGTTVISQQTVGDFDVVVLSAHTSSALIEWLDANGYAHGVDDDSVLDEYVADGWVFTAMRRHVEDGIFGDPEPDLFLWDTEPVAMTYDADELHYPMRLAALSASTTDSTRVLVYTIADERLTFEGARTRYANRISDIELRSIRDQAPSFGALLSPGVFLTRLERDYSVFEDKPDFTLDATES